MDAWSTLQCRNACMQLSSTLSRWRRRFARAVEHFSRNFSAGRNHNKLRVISVYILCHVQQGFEEGGGTQYFFVFHAPAAGTELGNLLRHRPTFIEFLLGEADHA